MVYKSISAFWRLDQHRVLSLLGIDDFLPSAELISQQTRGIHTMLFQCWSTVFDAGPTLKQHWVNVPRLLGAVMGVAVDGVRLPHLLPEIGFLNPMAYLFQKGQRRWANTDCRVSVRSEVIGHGLWGRPDAVALIQEITNMLYLTPVDESNKPDPTVVYCTFRLTLILFLLGFPNRKEASLLVWTGKLYSIFFGLIWCWASSYIIVDIQCISLYL